MVRQAGVVWHACGGCGRDWPFPKGHHVDREWTCAVCVSTLVAELRRVAEMTTRDEPERQRINHEMNQKLRDDLCKLLGLSMAMSDWDLLEHVEVLLPKKVAP